MQKVGDFLYWLLTLIAASTLAGMVVWCGWALYERESSYNDKQRYSQWIIANSLKLGTPEFDRNRTSLARSEERLSKATLLSDSAVDLTMAVAIVAAFVFCFGLSIRGLTLRPTPIPETVLPSKRWHDVVERR